MRGRTQAPGFGLALAVAWLAGFVPPVVAEETYHIAGGAKTTEVRFRSKATLETFEGQTSQLSGTLKLDPADLATMRGELVVDLASLDTGIGLRNKHMRDNVLHTPAFPTATLEITGSSGGRLGSGPAIQLTVLGKLTLHGATREIEVEATATLGEDRVLRFTASFPIALADYEIQRPKMLMMKVAETVDITVAAQATRGNPPEPAN